MPSLTAKRIDGHTYYYARYCQRVDGQPKIVRKSISAKSKISSLLPSRRISLLGPWKPSSPPSVTWPPSGILLNAWIWSLCSIPFFPSASKVSPAVNTFCWPPSTAPSLPPANCISPTGTATSLARLLPASPALLSSQNFWNYMDLVTSDKILQFERQMTQRLIERFQLDLRALVYDGTNFFTYINSAPRRNCPSGAITNRSEPTCVKSIWVCW